MVIRFKKNKIFNNKRRWNFIETEKVIYKATNIINNKFYIGKTSKTLDFRKLEHEKASKGKSILIFHRAIRKYGIENFNWEILYKCYDNLELNLKEIEFIKKLNPMPPNGYNLSTGGTGGNNISFNPNKENICQGISRKLKGIKRGQPTEEHKQKNRESNLGRKDSKKTIKKRSKAVAKSWTLISSENEIVTEFDISLKQYCEQNELSYNLLRKYRNNFVPFNKNTVKVKTIGWKLIENIKYQLNDNVKIGFCVISLAQSLPG